ncbi:MAG: hypothetical protein KGJ13_04910 [Patescibacteria group bacterium]|nr:hypothetical protein [Patescibacteria group bacterium]
MKNWKKLIARALMVTIILSIGLTAITHAQDAGGNGSGAGGTIVHGIIGGLGPIGSGYEAYKDTQKAGGLIDVGYWLIGKLAYGIGYLVAWIAGVAIGVEAWLIDVMLSLNSQVFSAGIVQTGFGIMLSLANLIFVLGIIIIALATILRNQSYGIKQLLWKLIVIAMLVNFGLVIMAPIVGIGNTLTQYFLNCIDPKVGCNNAPGAANNSSYSDFATALVTKFQPQNGFLALGLATTTGQGAITQTNPDVASSFSTASGLGNMMVPIFSLLFMGACLTIIVVTLATLVFMLLIRYIYLVMLAVLLPLAWASWVFPKFSHYWSRWWSELFRWTFFPFLVVFFIYLALVTATPINLQQADLQAYTSQSNTIWAALGNFLTKLFTPIIANGVNQIIIVALCIGGIFAANKLGIAGADAAMKTLGSAKDATMGYIGKQTKKAGRATFRAAKGEQLAAAMQKGKITRALKLDKVPIAGGFIGRRESQIGRGLASVQNNQELVEKESKNVSGDKASFEKNIAGFMTEERRMAELKNANEKGWIKRGMTVNGMQIEDYLDKNKNTFHAYGQDGEGSTEEGLRWKTFLLNEDVKKENGELKKKNDELDGRRGTINRATWKEKSKLNDADLDFYEAANKESAEEFALRPDADKERFWRVKQKAEEARAQLGLSDKEQLEYNKNKNKIDANSGKLRRLMAKDMETAANMFFDDEKARQQMALEGKTPPRTLDEKFLKDLRKTIVTSFAGFSPSNASEFLKAIAKANNLQHFEDAIKAMKETDKEGFANLVKAIYGNKELRRYISKQSGKNMTPEMASWLDIPKEQEKKGSGKKGEREEEEGEGEGEEENQPPQTKP